MSCREIRIIDPPSGWRYGFPKEYTRKENETLEEWLLKEGYPEWLIPQALKYSRYWTHQSEE